MQGCRVGVKLIPLKGMGKSRGGKNGTRITRMLRNRGCNGFCFWGVNHGALPHAIMCDPYRVSFLVIVKLSLLRPVEWGGLFGYMKVENDFKAYLSLFRPRKILQYLHAFQYIRVALYAFYLIVVYRFYILIGA